MNTRKLDKEFLQTQSLKREEVAGSKTVGGREKQQVMENIQKWKTNRRPRFTGWKNKDGNQKHIFHFIYKHLWFWRDN